MLRESWQNIAGQLGLTFQENFDAIFDSPILRDIAGRDLGGQDINKVKEMLAIPFFRQFFEKRFPCLVTGTIGKFQAICYPVAKNNSNSSGFYYHSHFHLCFSQKYGFEMSMKKNTFFGRLFGGGLSSHDPVFNKLVKVKAKNNPETVKAFLESAALINSAKELFTLNPLTQINDLGIKCVLRTGEPDPVQVKTLVETMKKTIECFY